MISRDRFESCFNLLVRVEARLVYKAVQPLAAELSLDFREDRFYWLELRTVTDVPYRFHVQLWPPLFDARLLMDACITPKPQNPMRSLYICILVYIMRNYTCLLYRRPIISWPYADELPK